MKKNLNISFIVTLLAFVFALSTPNFVRADDIQEEELISDKRASIIVDGPVSIFDKIKEIDGSAELEREFTIIDAFSCNIKRESLIELRENDISYHIEEKVEMVEDKGGSLDSLPFALSNDQDALKENKESYDGRGKVVAVLDSGVDVNHKDLQPRPINQRLKKEEVNAKGLKGRFYTDKVPYAYNYVDDKDEIMDTATTRADHGHGMHVIGIIAANSLDGSGLTGVAKNAQILSMKVFSNDPFDQGLGTEGAIIQALEDSLILGADVINLSLAVPSGVNNEEDPLQRAVQACIDKGIVVVAAAGNTSYSTYPNVMTEDPGSVGSPSIIEDTISVASYESDFMNLAAFKLGEKQIPYSKINGDITKISGLNIVDGADGNPDEIPKNNGIVLMHRSGLQFVDMVKSAYEKGAKAVIFYNREGDKEYVTNVGKIEQDIPVIFVSYEDGMFIKENIDKTPNFDELRVQIPNNIKGISVFSSQGPADGLAIKPEVTAIGGQVYSLTNNNEYMSMSGTSMATPYVAGVVVNYMNYLDEKGISYTPATIKSALMNTAEIKDHSGLAYAVTKQGAGMVSLPNLIKQELVLSYNNKAKIELGEIGPSTQINLDLKKLTEDSLDVNVSFTDVMTFDAENNETIVLEGASISADTTSFNLADENASITVNLNIPENHKSYVNGFIIVEANGRSVSIPYLGYAGDYKNLPIFDKNLNDPDSIFKEQGLFSQVFIDKFRYGLLKQGGKDMDPDLFSINPDDRNAKTNIFPKISLLRNIKDLNIYVNNDQGETIRYIDYQKMQRKSNSYEGRTFLGDELWIWNGNYYDKNKGERVSADEGKYEYIVEASPMVDGADTQKLVFPIKVDKTPPLVSSGLIVTGTDQIELRIQAEDRGDISTDIEDFMFVVNGEPYRENGKALFTLEKEYGVYRKKITLDQDLPDMFEIQVGALDYAGNLGTGVYKIARRNDEFKFESEGQRFGINEEIKLSFEYPGAASYKIFRMDKEKAIVETDKNEATIKISDLGDKKLIAEAYDENGEMIALNALTINIRKEGTVSEIETDANNVFSDRVFNTKLDIVNKYSEKKNITYITAVYDENMKLINSVASTIDLDAYNKTSVTNVIYVGEDAHTIKNFVWDDFEGLSTIIDEEVIPVETLEEQGFDKAA